jgi:hypothetical protein
MLTTTQTFWRTKMPKRRHLGWEGDLNQCSGGEKEKERGQSDAHVDGGEGGRWEQMRGAREKEEQRETFFPLVPHGEQGVLDI